MLYLFMKSTNFPPGKHNVIKHLVFYIDMRIKILKTSYVAKYATC